MIRPALGKASPHPIARCLGTRIFELELEKGATVFLLSDLHLRPEQAAALDAFRAFLEGLPGSGPVLIMGDLFDYWIGRSQIGQGGWQDILDALARATSRGLRLYVFHGNRDFQLDRAFERATGTRVVPGALLLRRRGDRDLLCMHGDELCVNDRSYQRAKRWLRSPPLRLLLGVLPYRIARRLADGARRRSAAVLEGTDPELLHPSRRAMAMTRTLGTQDLCFGHIHVAGHGALAGEGEALCYYVLPAFEPGEQGHARWEPQGPLTLYRSGKAVPWTSGSPLGD
ncbi:MAG: UDP-2,3-diacylglucosamine diphosphatase [Planctomycetota bacterium]